MKRKVLGTLLGCVLLLTCFLGLTVQADEGTTTASAEVKGHSLTIKTGEVAVNFCVDIDGMNDSDSVKVTMNGNTETKTISELTTTDVLIDAKSYECYVFTQTMAAKRMDDDISFSLADAAGNVLAEDTYSVNDYVTEVEDAGYGLNMENLTKAMSYYGEFAEVYFKYNNSSGAGTNASASIADVDADDLKAYAMSRVNADKWPEGLAFYGAQLNLVSKTTLRLCFTIADDKTASSFGEFKAVSGNSEISLGTLQKGGYGTAEYYYVDITGLGAHELDKAYTILCNNTEIISNCRVLSYAYSVLKTYSDDTDKVALVNLSKALYQYNQNAKAYVEAPTTGVYDLYYNGNGIFAEPSCTNAVYLTSDKEVTTVATGNTQITSLAQLNGSRTNGCSVWMISAYTVSSEESLTGPYVIRRYTGNTGNVLNVTGTATVQAKVDGSLVTDGTSYVARYAGEEAATEKVNVAITKSEDAVSASNSLVNVGANATFAIADGGIIQNSHVENGEIYVSGTPTAFSVTGNAKSGVVTVDAAATKVSINAAGITAEAAVVLANYDRQSLTGDGVASAVTILDDGMNHYGVVKHESNLRIASVICVCGDDVTGEEEHKCPWTGGVDGIANVYDIPWQGYADTKTTLPTTAGYYYLLGDISVYNWAELGNSNIICLDLNGKKVTRYLETDTSNAKYNRMIQLKGNAKYMITDSADTGEICFADTFVSKTDGALLFFSGAATFEVYNGKFDMSNIKGSYVPIKEAQSSTVKIYGGTFEPANNTSTEGNCFSIGNGTFFVGGEAKINGDVYCRGTTATFTISGSPTIGSATNNYGIGIKADDSNAVTITCNNVTEDAQIVLKSETNVTVTEADGSSSEVSGFELIDGGKDGHYGVVKKITNSDTGAYEFGFAHKICVCGADVSDEPGHTCEWLDGTTNTIDTVYSLGWEEWNTQLSKDSHATTDPIRLPVTTGYYYLTEDLNLDSRAFVTDAVVYLDLNGYTVTKTGGANEVSDRVINIYNASVVYSIADSKGDGTIQFASDYSTTTSGGFAFYEGAGTINLYSGTIDMSNVAQAQANMIDVAKGSFNVHGGIIKPTVAKVSGVSNCIGVRGTTGATVTVTGGSIYGEVILQTSSATLNLKKNAKVGLPLTAESTQYGISAYEDSTENLAKVVCDNVTASAQVVFNSGEHLTLSGTGAVSAFVVPSAYEVIDTGGQLSIQKKNNEQ